jgi:hypothetical protein
VAYGAEISRYSPACFLFVIDQSGSMDEKLEGGLTKSQFVADVLNKTLYQLVIRCTRSDGVRDYFDVGVIAYGGSGVASAFSGPLASQFLHPLSAIEANPLRVEERTKRVEVLLFNLHIDVGSADSIIFPSSETILPDDNSRLLFRMSSPFPKHLIDAARERGYDAVTSESRFFGYKAGIEGIVDFFDIGTRAGQFG